MTDRTIKTSNAPAAIGTYSQAVRAGDLVFISGQIPLDPATMEVVEGDIDAQITQVFKNLTAICVAAGGSINDVVKFQVDLTDLGLDEKVLLRSDGTSVYLTQDLGTAERRYHDFGMNESIYVVANEQEYHFKALQATLKKLGKPFADGIYHLSYGMVDLPTGKMKSREGTTVDADDLYDEMIATATAMTNELGKAEGLGTDEAATLYRTIGLGALKYYLLRVHPKKRILFDPQESIQFQGDTGPFIQYTHARIRSVVRKWEAAGSPTGERQGPLSDLERELIILLYRYPGAILEAAREFDPSHLATYAFHLAKQYNRFYAEHPILQAETPGQQYFRVQLSMHLARVLKHSFGLLGIDVPEVM